MAGTRHDGSSFRGEPAPAGKRGQALAELRELQQGGWYWSETTPNLLLSPGDSEAHVRYDPFTCDLLFSAKIVAMMGELLWEDQGGGPGR